MNSQEFLTQYYDLSISKLGGWFNRRDAEIMYIINQLHQSNDTRGDICEIGVFKGKSLLLLHKLLREDEHIFGFDIFGKGAGGENYIEALIENIKNIAPDSKNIKLFKGSSQNFNFDTTFIKDDIRMLHIDGDHDHPAVLHDLKAFFPLLSKSNDWVIIMDDYPNRDFPGVASAVWDFVYRHEGKDLKAFAGTPNKMYFCHRSRVQFFRDAIEKTGMKVVHRIVDGVTIVVTDPNTTESLRGTIAPVKLD